MTDVALENAQIIWDQEPPKGEMPIKIIDIKNGQDDDRYSSSWGACNGEFLETDDAGRLRMLFVKFHQLVTVYGIEPRLVDLAFMDIPEYRAALIEAGTLPPSNDDG